MSDTTAMNGAESLVRTLLDAGVDHCFANPGTSEMHLVQAIDAVPAMRPVLCLFEGVCSGAADGFGRMAGRPAMTLLHLGAGLGNAVANLHNARRAASPIVNVVGDHARHHVAYDAPLTSDIEGIARPFSAWVRTARSPQSLAADGAEAVRAALTPNPVSMGQVSTLIVPVDCAWGPAHAPALPRTPAARVRVSDAAVEAAARSLAGADGGAEAVLLLDGAALGEAGQRAAARIAERTGCRVLATTFPARIDQGPGLPPLERLPYFPEQVMKTLAGVTRLILAGAQAPVAFFAYPDTPSDLVPAGCACLTLAEADEDVAGALEALADAVGAAPAPGRLNVEARPQIADQPLDTRLAAAVIAAMLPEQAIVTVDSGGGGAAAGPCQSAARHSWLNLTGGAIGMGGPLATGAALACPDRPVLALLGDGGAMYTNQAFWTQAREGLNVITVIFNNGMYRILDHEYRRLGVNEVGERAASLFDLRGPDLDWVAMAKAFGVPGERVDSTGALAAAIGRGLASGGPRVIEAMV
ncbi:MAG TPA: acetolactate synthase large subunit [Pseudomonadales bacterium]|nr:acetolactate synthase large subunit [Pseudomonadales bacterium]